MEHTADVGIRACGRSREELFANCARGMMSLILDPGRVVPREEVDIAAEAAELEALLVRWLSEILFLVEAEGWAFADFEVWEVTGKRVRGKGAGEPLDPDRHLVTGEIKAPTYHQLRVAEEGGTWVAQVIFDV
ncbi:MAG: archease [Actinomycetota bacterium]